MLDFSKEKFPPDYEVGDQFLIGWSDWSEDDVSVWCKLPMRLS
jgi:hypothetical protein